MKRNRVFREGLTGVLALTILACAPSPERDKPSSRIGSSVPLTEARLHGDEVIATPYGDVTLNHTYVSGGSDALFAAMDFQRACQAYIWSTPAVSFKQWMKSQAEVFNARELGEFVVYDSLKEKRGIVTANLTTPYVINFLTLADGPIRVEVPAGAMAGMFLDLLQRPVVDIGLTGPDAGRGGSYIIVGPTDDPTRYDVLGPATG